MNPDLILGNEKAEEEENSDTVFSSLETPYNYDYNFDTMFNEYNNVKMRSMPEFQCHQCLIYPDDFVKQIWDIIVMMLMCYTVTVTPYRVAFIEVDDLSWIIVDLIIDGLFGLDVAINFFTPFWDATENLVVDKKKIAMNYLSTWFIIDLISCFPFQIIFEQESDWGSLMRMGRLPRLYRIIKFSKIARVIKAYRNRGKCLAVLSCCSRINIGLERISYLLIMSLIVIHIVGCMWYFVDRFDYPSVDSWVVKYKQADSSNLDVYLSSCYWAITTLATVGFGDIVPASTLGRMYCSLVMLLGIVFYSYTIGTVTGLLGDFDRRQTKLHAKLSALQDISKKYKLSHKFFKQLKISLEQDQYRVRKEREDVLNSLPKKLAARLTLVMHKHLLQNNRFFKQRSLKFLQSLLPLLRPAKIASEEVIYRVYEVCDEMYFVGRGRLAYFIDELHTHVIYEEIKDKDYFGDIEFFFADQRETNVKGLTVCEILALARDDLFNKLFPEFSDLKIEMIVEAATTRERLKKLREEAEQKRREQYKRAKGVPITLSFNEIERLNEMQPSLKSELLFEEEEVSPEANRKAVADGSAIVVQSFNGDQEEPKEVPLFTKLLELTPREAADQPLHKQMSLEPPGQKQALPDLLALREVSLDPPVQKQASVDPPRVDSLIRKKRRSITNPQPATHPEEQEEEADCKEMRITGLRTLLNTHTLALLEPQARPKESDEVLKAYNRIEARLDRIEELLAGLTETKKVVRRSSVIITPAYDPPGDSPY